MSLFTRETLNPLGWHYYNKKIQIITSVDEDLEKLVGLQYGATALENSLEIPQNVKHSYHKTQQFHC